MGDPLDPMTAYLFTRYSQETLSNYRFNGTVSQRKYDANQLQKAIWSIEQEYALKATDAKAQAWVTEAQNAGWNDIGHVRVLNLYGNYSASTNTVSGFRQDVLVKMPVPGAMLLGMLGLGTAGARLRRRFV
jgi:hypothetical protein